MKPTCIALDLDYTLTHFIGGYDNLFAIFMRRGVAHEIIQEIYKETQREGFTIKLFTKKIKDKTGELPQETTVTAEFERWLHESLAPYPDTTAFFAQWFGKIPIAIVTFGDPDYQKQKLGAVSLPHDIVFTIAPPHRKSEALRTLVSRYGKPIIFVDDTLEMLDSVRNDGLCVDEIITVEMRRPDRASLKTPMYPHHRVTSLDEVGRLIHKEY